MGSMKENTQMNWKHVVQVRDVVYGPIVKVKCAYLLKGFTTSKLLNGTNCIDP